MAATLTIPITVTPEAAARVAELGLRRELETILKHTEQTVPDLQAIEVEVFELEEELGQPHVLLIGWRDGVSSSPDDFRAETDWGTWLVSAYPPEVVWWFNLEILYRDEHGR